MDMTRRRELAGRLLDGYVHGPAAATEATARALVKATAADAVVLVEGISDQIAVETLAARRDWDLGAEGVVVLPVGGAHAVTRYLMRFGPAGAGLRLAGLCDLGEEDVFRRGLAARRRRLAANAGRHGAAGLLRLRRGPGGRADPRDRRWPGRGLIDSQGDLGSFRSLQRQPQWRGQPVVAQLRRFLGSGARRKLRYARLLAGAVDLDYCRIRSTHCSGACVQLSGAGRGYPDAASGKATSAPRQRHERMLIVGHGRLTRASWRVPTRSG